MSDPRHDAIYAAKLAAIENAGVHDFIHPANAMETFDDEQSKADATEMFVRLLLRCLPSKAHGIHRTAVGYRRMCVLVYTYAPTYFEGMTKRDLAKYLGISKWALTKEFQHVRSMLGTTANSLQSNVKQKPSNGKTNCKKRPGPFCLPPPVQVPRDA